MADEKPRKGGEQVGEDTRKGLTAELELLTKAVEQTKAMTDTDAWAHMSAWLRTEIEAAKDALLTADSTRDVVRLQQRVLAFGDFLDAAAGPVREFSICVSTNPLFAQEVAQEYRWNSKSDRVEVVAKKALKRPPKDKSPEPPK